MNYLQHALETLDLIIPTEDINLLYSHQDKNTLFSTVNVELKLIANGLKLIITLPEYIKKTK